MIGGGLARGNQFRIVRGFSCPTNRYWWWQRTGIHTSWILCPPQGITTLSKPMLNCRERLSNFWPIYCLPRRGAFFVEYVD